MAFRVLKRKPTNAMRLAHFGKEAPTKVIADASPVGLGRSWFKNNHILSCRCELRQPQSIRRRASLLLCHLCRFTPVFILLGYTRSVPDKDL